jgi:hypothetical protein
MNAQTTFNTGAFAKRMESAGMARAVTDELQIGQSLSNAMDAMDQRLTWGIGAMIAISATLQITVLGALILLKG